MATVTNWIDHLSAAEVQGAIYPGVGTEGVLVIIALIIWIGWHVLQDRAESEHLSELSRKKHGANDHKSNITEW